MNLSGRVMMVPNKLTISKRIKQNKAANHNSETTPSLYTSNQAQASGGACLLLIDPQVDFVTGSLAVPGAEDDCLKTARFIRDSIDHLEEIYVTLDTHMNYHIAHPVFWKDAEDNQPAHFTQISHEDVKNGRWIPADENMKDWVLHYTETLEKKPRLEGLPAFKLTIWPPHCLVGTPGHNVEKHIADALSEWENKKLKTVNYVIKGNNSKTEHYSAFRAEVIVKEDVRTHLNTLFLRRLESHSKIFVAGEAKSHCVNFTVRDLVDGIGPRGAAKRKVILLDGAMSSVPGCEAQGEEFMSDMKDIGLKIHNLKKDRIYALGDGLRKSVNLKFNKEEMNEILQEKTEDLKEVDEKEKPVERKKEEKEEIEVKIIEYEEKKESKTEELEKVKVNETEKIEMELIQRKETKEMFEETD